jgi:hypothetical protein
MSVSCSLVFTGIMPSRMTVTTLPDRGKIPSTRPMSSRAYSLNIVPFIVDTTGKMAGMDCMMVFLKGERQDSEEKRGEESQNRNSPTFNKRAERDNLNRVHLDEHNLQTAVEQDHKCHLLQTCGVLKTPSWRRKLSNCSLTGPEERYLAPCEAHHWSSMALSASMLTASVAIPWCNRDRHTTSLYGSA